MADGGEQVSRALAMMDQFYVSMMESGVLKILAFQYECYAEITEETYLKFLANFSTLATSVKALNEVIFTTDRADVACQTSKVSLPSLVQNSSEVLDPWKVQKVNIADNFRLDSPPPPPPPTVSKVITPKIQSSTKRDPMVCDYCEQKFTTLENFELHIRQVHGDKFSRAVFSCHLCEKHFLSSETLYEHISCAHNLTEDEEETGDQLCAYCADICTSWQELADHLVSNHEMHMCRTCHIICDDKNILIGHINDVHLTGVKPELLTAIPLPPKPVGRPPNEMKKIQEEVSYIIPRKRGRPRKIVTDVVKTEVLCTICKLSFPTEESLKCHKVHHHEPEVRDLTCKKCNLVFRRRSALENHMRIVHNKYDLSELSDSEEDKKIIETETIVPDILPINVAPEPVKELVKPTKAIKSSNNNKKPPKQTTAVRASRLNCEVCGELCSQAEDQEIHKDHHITLKPDNFLCLYCAADPMTQPELRTHIVSEHRYRCPFCSLTFWWRTNLENHLMQLHSSKEECPKCNFKGTVEDLRSHVLFEHTPRKSYLCKLCGAEHMTVKEMNQHELDHIKPGQDLMICNLCQRCFGTRSRLKLHMTRHMNGSFCCYLCGQVCHTQEQLQHHLNRHRKSQFACFCGKRFTKKPDLKAHQRANICHKKTLDVEPLDKMFVEVCVPVEDVDPVLPDFCQTPPKLQRINEESQNNVWQINIEVPVDTHGGQLSRDFLSALAHSVSGIEGQEGQQILILETGNDSLIDGSDATEIVQWVQEESQDEKLSQS